MEYDARVDDKYEMLVNGEVQEFTKKVNGRLKTRIRVEVKVDHLAVKKLGKFQEIMLEWRFNKQAYQKYRIKK